MEIKTDLDLDFFEEGILFHLIRFMSFAQLRTSKGWTAPHKAIIDIGTPISVIPRFIWKNAQVKWLSPRKVTLTGIGSGKVQGRLGEVTLVFSDEQATSLPIQAKVHLLDDNSVPLLIGCEDILSQVDLFISYRKKVAYFELPLRRGRKVSFQNKSQPVN